MYKTLITVAALLTITASFAGDYSAPAIDVQGQSTPVLLAYDIPVTDGKGHTVPIWHNADAQKKCPIVCANFGGWSGSWTPIKPKETAVCGCKVNAGKGACG